MVTTPRKFSITLPQSIANELAAIAEREGRSKANLACFAVELYVRASKPEKFKPPVAVEGLKTTL